MTLADTATTGATDVFRYGSYEMDARTRTLVCSYFIRGHRFEERVLLDSGSPDADRVDEAALLVFLLAGVSYYKAFAPAVIDLGDHPVSREVRSFLRSYYIKGLGEFAYRNGLDLRGVDFVGGRDIGHTSTGESAVTLQRPLIPFGGGMDSLVSVELARRVTPDAALFIVSGIADRFEAIERAAAATGLPVVRATRQLDPKILRSREHGFLNGHVPVTGILSAIAILAAVMCDRDAVVMSNEWSASVGNAERDGQVINHQYSKSLSFERDFRRVARRLIGETPQYFSLLRPYSELWIAREFAKRGDYVKVFRSCNRGFHIDPSQRLDRWCGRCDKCVFIDLILSPFVDRDLLSRVFDDNEPLESNDLLPAFRTLIGTTADIKPFECVGDVGECRAAVLLAAARPDRHASSVLQALREEVEAALEMPVPDRYLAPMSEHFIPNPYATDLRLA
jgi:hypothetical protein